MYSQPNDHIIYFVSVTKSWSTVTLRVVSQNASVNVGNEIITGRLPTFLLLFSYPNLNLIVSLGYYLLNDLIISL